MEITPTRHVTIGRWTVPVPWVAALAVLALTAALLSVVASPSSATHAGDAGTCGVTKVLERENSSRVFAVFPPGAPGTKLAFEVHCNPGGPSDYHLPAEIMVEDVQGNFYRAAEVVIRFVSGGGNERLQTNELHLPVQAVAAVCIRDPRPTPEYEQVCVPPK